MTPEPTARRAVLGDEREIARLRILMINDLWGPPNPGPWDDAAVAGIRAWLIEPATAATATAATTTAVFVVDAPDGPGLAASVIGAIEELLPSERNPTGRLGYVYGVATDTRHRRRGYSRLAMTALLDWYTERGISRVDLHASEFGDALYRELGFEDSHGTALTWHNPKLG